MLVVRGRRPREAGTARDRFLLARGRGRAGGRKPAPPPLLPAGGGAGGDGEYGADSESGTSKGFQTRTLRESRALGTRQETRTARRARVPPQRRGLHWKGARHQERRTGSGGSTVFGELGRRPSRCSRRADGGEAVLRLGGVGDAVDSGDREGRGRCLVGHGTPNRERLERRGCSLELEGVKGSRECGVKPLGLLEAAERALRTRPVSVHGQVTRRVRRRRLIPMGRAIREPGIVAMMATIATSPTTSGSPGDGLRP